MQHENYYQQFLNQNSYPRELKNDDEKKLINFSSNDYLGLAKNPLLIQRSQEYAEKFGVGSTSSRLVAGNFSLYEALEKKLAKKIGKPATLIFGTGYQANTSVLEALFDSRVLGGEPRVFCDRFCHVSLLATTKHLTRLHRFQHNNLDHLEVLLKKYVDETRPAFILAESIYSMDGDKAEMEKLIFLAKKYHAFLYLDDAHAFGVEGIEGFGIAANYSNQIDIVMGTFSKAAGSFGAYIACSTLMRNYLINKCRGLIYSTGLPPAVLGAIDAAIELFPQLQKQREVLHRRATELRQFFEKHKIDYGNANTHIIPWIIGDSEKTIRASELLEAHGILGATIRPPSVPVGKSRIRFCLSTAHTDEEIERLKSAILVVRQKLF